MTRTKKRRPRYRRKNKPIETAVVPYPGKPYPDAPELPCGCVPGYVCCPRAEELRKLVLNAYRRYRAGPGTWKEYCEARDTYSQHYLGERVQPL